MRWWELLSEERQSGSGNKSSEDMRTEFQRDYHRIIGSASFRRLQDKTQVFPLDKSDFIRTRLTHSLEVSSFAKSLGQSCFTYIIENHLDSDVNGDVKEAACNILECAGLIHDIGNPPFGHFGEDSIREWFKANLSKLEFKGQPVDKILTDQMKNDLLNFEGNAQALRLLTKLHYLVDEHGMHLTYALLNTIVKYPVSSLEINKNSGNIKDKKMGYYYAEERLFKQISSTTGAKDCRYPLTYLLEAADDIAYKTADIEDAVKKGCLTYDVLLEELSSDRYMSVCADAEETKKYKSAVAVLKKKYKYAADKGTHDPGMNAVQNWVIYVQGVLLKCAAFGFTSNYKAIMHGSFKKEVLAASYGNALSIALSDIAYRYAFCSKPIYKLEIAAGTIIDFMLDKFVHAALYFDSENRSPVDDKLYGLISENYKQVYRIYSEDKDDAEKLYLRLLLVTDFICGMTDSYAKSLYQEFNGIS